MNGQQLPGEVHVSYHKKRRREKTMCWPFCMKHPNAQNKATTEETCTCSAYTQTAQKSL